MEIREWASSADLNPIYRSLREMNLEQNLLELNTFGLTVVKNLLPERAVDELRNRLMEIATRRGLFEGGDSELRPGQYKGVGVLLHYLLFEDPGFEKILLEPHALALITYLLGEGCLLSSCTGMLKGSTNDRSILHTDNGMIPSPFPQYAQVANATWVLTDYTREDGCLAYVPGSHLLCRHPTADERLDEGLLVPVEAPPGSLIVWHGNLWHGAIPKQSSGLRVNLIMLFCRMHCITQELFGDRVPAEIIERNPPRFARLMGSHVAYGWNESGPDFSTPERQAYLDLHREANEHLYG